MTPYYTTIALFMVNIYIIIISCNTILKDYNTYWIKVTRKRMKDLHKSVIVNLPFHGHYDNVFCGKEHDHIGIIVDVTDKYPVAAERNISSTNRSGLEGNGRAYSRSASFHAASLLCSLLI